MKVAHSLKPAEFLQMRKKAMEERKERQEKSQHEAIDTIPEIAAMLKETTMVRGKNDMMTSLFH